MKSKGGNIFDDIANTVSSVASTVAPIVTTVAPIVASLAGGSVKKHVFHCGNCFKKVAKNSKKCRHCGISLGGSIFGDIADFAKSAYNTGKDVYDQVAPIAKPIISTGMTAYSLYNALKGAGIITPYHESLMVGKGLNVGELEQKSLAHQMAPDLHRNGYNDVTKFNEAKWAEERKRFIVDGGSYPVGGSEEHGSSYPVAGRYSVGGSVADKYKALDSKRSRDEILRSILKKHSK